MPYTVNSECKIVFKRTSEQFVYKKAKTNPRGERKREKKEVKNKCEQKNIGIKNYIGSN